jgi:hypothetical protein
MTTTSRPSLRFFTGSVTVYYDKEILTGEHVLQILQSAGFVSGDVRIADPGPTNPVANRIGEKIGKAAFGMVLEKVIERSAVALVAAIS